MYKLLCQRGTAKYKLLCRGGEGGTAMYKLLCHGGEGVYFLVLPLGYDSVKYVGRGGKNPDPTWP